MLLEVAVSPVDRPATAASQERCGTPGSSLALSRNYSVRERTDRSVQTDFGLSGLSMRYVGASDAEDYLRHPSPGAQLLQKSSLGQSLPSFVEMVRPVHQTGDLDSVYGAMTTEESARVQIPELLDFAESNLEAASAYSGTPLPLRSGGLVISHCGSTGMPLIMRNKYFAGQLIRSPKVVTQQTAVSARGDKQRWATAQKRSTVRKSYSETVKVELSTGKPPRPGKPVKHIRASFGTKSPLLSQERRLPSAPFSPRKAKQAVRSSSQKSLQTCVTEMTPKRVVVNLQDFASRETGSDDHSSYWSSEPEPPMNAPVPHVDAGLIDEIAPLISSASTSNLPNPGFNLVSQYRQTPATLEVMLEDDTQRLLSAHLSKSVPHGIRPAELIKHRGEQHFTQVKE